MRVVAFILAFVLTSNSIRADVIINEIMYHAPEDLDDLQFVEFHNTASKPADIAGWKISKSFHHKFPEGATIPANGFYVICKDAELFQKHYKMEPNGVFSGSLKRNGGTLDLHNKTGLIVDTVTFRTRSPWPVAADGCSSSLERICSTHPGKAIENWAASLMSKGPPKPAGTPGRPNSVHLDHFPPVIRNVSILPKQVGPNQPITVSAIVDSQAKSVSLIYGIASSNSESDDVTLPMTKTEQGSYSATIPGQSADRIVRLAIVAKGEQAERVYPHANDIRPRLSVYVHEAMQPGKIPFGKIINVGRREYRTNQQKMYRSYGPPSPPTPERGNSAFVYLKPDGTATLFDFVSITPRAGGFKVHFHKNRTLDGISTINLVFEGHERFLLAEPLAYEVYRQAGNAACRTDYIRTWLDGKPLGYHLLVEQPNRSFLRHNKMPTDGQLYKCVWFARTLIGQHEKKTYPHSGHDDLKEIVDLLNKTQGDEQWAVIKKHFDVEQVINYFAVNMVLSHWDGYFNNYFTYHDVKRTGKWTMYPWDQDKTWGFHDGIGEDQVFTNMPITFGMAGDRPPGHPADQPPPPFLTRNAVWWRPGGYFSKPLLANPTFRKHFLARTKEILETVYTEAEFNPRIDALGERLQEEVRVRAELSGENPDHATRRLAHHLSSLKEHLTKRRAFLLDQDEIKSAGKFDRNAVR